MADRVASHYSDNRKLADAIAQSLRSADKDVNKLTTMDLAEESQAFFERMTAQMAKTGSPPVAWRLFLGDDFPAMARNQVRNVTERRIRTVSFICVA
jgi:hypothetical protein